MPPRSRSSHTGGGGVSVSVHVNAARATEDFRVARRDVNARTKAGLLAAGELVALPAAKALASGLAVTDRSGNKSSTAGSLIVRARTRSAVLTTNLRGPLARAVGLQEFGGTVTTPIVPRSKLAVVVGGQPVARVDTPRHYTGRRFLRDAVEANRGGITRAIASEIDRAFDGFAY